MNGGGRGLGEAGALPGLEGLRALLGDLGVPPGLVRADVTLDGFVAAAGEPAFAALVLHLEASLPEPFPAELLDQVETLGELLEFARIKHSRKGE